MKAMDFSDVRLPQNIKNKKQLGPMEHSSSGEKQREAERKLEQFPWCKGGGCRSIDIHWEKGEKWRQVGSLHI